MYGTPQKSLRVFRVRHDLMFRHPEGVRQHPNPPLWSDISPRPSVFRGKQPQCNRQQRAHHQPYLPSSVEYTTKMMTNTFFAIFLASLTAGAVNAFVRPVAIISTSSTISASRSSSRALSMGGGEGGLTRAEAIKRAAVGSGALLASTGVLLAPQRPAYAEIEAPKGKDGIEQFGDLKEEIEKKDKSDQVTLCLIAV